MKVSYWVARAWEDVGASTIINLGKCCWVWKQKIYIEENIIPLFKHIPGCENSELDAGDNQFEIKFDN